MNPAGPRPPCGRPAGNPPHLSVPSTSHHAPSPTSTSSPPLRRHRRCFGTGHRARGLHPPSRRRPDQVPLSKISFSVTSTALLLPSPPPPCSSLVHPLSMLTLPVHRPSHQHSELQSHLSSCLSPCCRLKLGCSAFRLRAPTLRCLSPSKALLALPPPPSASTAQPWRPPWLRTLSAR